MSHRLQILSRLLFSVLTHRDRGQRGCAHPAKASPAHDYRSLHPSHETPPTASPSIVVDSESALLRGVSLPAIKLFEAPAAFATMPRRQIPNIHAYRTPICTTEAKDCQKDPAAPQPRKTIWMLGIWDFQNGSCTISAPPACA